MEIVIHILQYLPVKGVVNFCLSCKHFSHLSNDDSIWKRLCIRDFFSDSSPKASIKWVESTLKWKDYYSKFGISFPPSLPGAPASFKQIPSKDWHVFYKGYSVIRELCFKSKAEKSLFRKFEIFGHENGSIVAYLNLSEEGKKQEGYWQALGFRLKYTELGQAYFRLTCSDDLKKIFLLLKTSDQIPEKDSELVETLLRAPQARWDLVTPLSKEEEKTLTQQKKEVEPESGLTPEERAWVFASAPRIWGWGQ
jgi:hypothetical protein